MPPTLRLDRVRTARHRWVGGYAAVVAVLVLVYYLPALDPTVRTWAYPAVGILSAAAVLVGIRIHRPSHPGPWLLIAAGTFLFSMGDILWTVLAAMGELPFPSVADLAYISGYPVLAIAFLWMIGIRVGDGDRSGMLDAATIALAAALVGWIVLLRPVMEADADPLSLLVSVAYPLGDLVLIGVAIGMLATPGSRTPAFALLVASLVTMFMGDVIYALQVAEGTNVDGGPLDLTWLFSYAAMGGAALLPSMRSVAVASPVRIAWLSPVRLSFTAVAMLTGPALLLLDISGPGTSVTLLAVGSAVLSLMVLARLAVVVRELARDNAARRALEEELSFRASHDPLTGLANRRRFMECLESAVKGADGQPISVLFLDLDGFKAINDALGHATGDALLVAVAKRIRGHLRGADVAARMGGDEFGILLHADERAAMTVAQRLLSSLGDPVAVGGHAVAARGSIGLSVACTTKSATEILADADMAMYAAKARGSGHAMAFEPGMRHVPPAKSPSVGVSVRAVSPALT